MIIFLGFTALFQILINQAFGPLFKYLPITFEDEAVQRDEEFQRAQATRWQRDEQDEEHRSLNSELEAKEKEERHEDEVLEQQDEANQRHSRSFPKEEPESFELKQMSSSRTSTVRPRKESWADRSRSRSQSQSHHNKQHKKKNPLGKLTEVVKGGLDDVARPMRDIEAQILPSSNLFDDIDGTLEDMEPEARQKLIKRAFQHPATRAIQPAVWIPHDELGIAKDEIQRTAQFSGKIWITSINARVNASGNVLYKGLPPDRDPFENIEV